VGGTCGTHGRGMCIGFWWQSRKQRGHFEDQGVDGIRMDLREIGWGVLSGFSWLKIRIGGGLL
jgi:uncharacterized membrane protein